MSETLELELDVKGLGPARRAKVLEKFGSAEAAAKASLEELTAIDGVSKIIANRIRNLNPDKATKATKSSTPKPKAKAKTKARVQKKATTKASTKRASTGNGHAKVRLTAGDVRLIARSRQKSEAEQLQAAVADLFDDEAVPAARLA